MYKLKCSVLLVFLCGIVVNSYPFQKLCKPHQIEATKERYIRKLWDEADDLEEIGELLVEAKARVQRKLNELEEKVAFVIEFAEENGFDIQKCLDFEYINNIPVDAVQQLKKLIDLIENGSNGLVGYVQHSINLIHGCGGLHAPCKRIEKCCKDVVEDFDDDVIEDGVEHLEKVAEQRLRSILRKIDNDIKNILEATDLCYVQHQQSTTTETPVAPTEPIQEVTTEKPVQQTTTEEPVQETTTEESVQETTTEKPVQETTTEESVQETTTEEPVQETKTEEPVQETTTEESVPETTTEESVQETTTEEPVQETTTEEPVKETTTEESVQETTTEESVQETTPEKPVQETTESVVETTTSEEGEIVEPTPE